MHLWDVHVKRNQTQKHAGEPFRAKHSGLLDEWNEMEVCGDQGRTQFIAVPAEGRGTFQGRSGY